MSIHKTLSVIQAELVAPKGQYNNFGKYHYRNCEDILQALKSHLAKHGCTVTISDEITAISGRIYVKATATLANDKGESISTTAYARESESKKGMDDSQLTGATSSYARKYALNGLFAIDDNKDADHHAGQGQGQTSKTAPLPDNIFASMLSALKNGVDKHGNPFTMQSVFDFLNKNHHHLTVPQRQQLGV